MRLPRRPFSEEGSQCINARRSATSPSLVLAAMTAISLVLVSPIKQARFPKTGVMSDNTGMDFHPDDMVLELLDVEILAVLDRCPEVSAMAVFETTSGARHLLSTREEAARPTPHRSRDGAETTFETDVIAIVFIHDAGESSVPLNDRLFRAARRIHAIVDPHLRLHLEWERGAQARARRSERRSRDAYPC